MAVMKLGSCFFFLVKIHETQHRFFLFCSPSRQKYDNNWLRWQTIAGLSDVFLSCSESKNVENEDEEEGRKQRREQTDVERMRLKDDIQLQTQQHFAEWSDEEEEACTSMFLNPLLCCLPTQGRVQPEQRLHQKRSMCKVPPGFFPSSVWQENLIFK